MWSDLRCEEQWTAVGATLYRLSDGRYWLDAMFTDEQGFLSSDRGAALATHMKPRDEYGGEPLDNVLTVYQANSGRSFDEMTRDIPQPYAVELFPTEPGIRI